MTYSEDYPSFAGDQTGQLLAEPDVVALSPVTSARVVETQSGYLVVLKKADDRLSLSVKRRIGTPPSSQVLLTPDESIQLSRVLSDSVETLGAVRGDYLIRSVPEEVPSIEPSATDNELSTIYGGNGAEPTEAQLDWDEIKQPWRKRRAKQSVQELENPASEQATREPWVNRLLNLKPILITAGGIAVVAGLIGLVAFVSTSLGQPKDPSKTAAASAKPSDPMGADNVDKFVRGFVANMLDFNPRTYRASQVHAMSVMQPELLERYWQETAFPLPKSKLRSLHKDQTLIINKVLQQPSSAVTTDVEMSADLVTPGQSDPTTVRLQIDLGLDQEGHLMVLDLKDSSPKGE